MKTILLDVDGVLLDTGKRILQYLEEHYPEQMPRLVLGSKVHLNPDLIFCWDWEYALGVEWRNNEAFWSWFWSEPLEEYPGAREFVENIKAAGYRVNACSNRTYGPARDAAIRDFHVFGFDEIAIVDDPKDKFMQAYKWGGVIFSLEDNPKNAYSLATLENYSVGFRSSFLLTRPWNSRCADFRNPTWSRVDDYAHFLREITGGY
jgi:phosphoglycolate phosphatase-like HAD superfamily hydrolase